MNIQSKIDIREIGDTLLEVGSLLMSSGANSFRIRKTVERISGAFNLNVELLITNRALMVTLTDENGEQFHSSLKRTSPHGVNFKLVSGISRMSWRVVDDGWNVTMMKNEIARLKALPHYNRLILLLMIGLAGASFCRLFGGNWQDMMVTFGATFCGLFIRQEALKKSFNPYLAVFFGALTASLIACAFLKFGNNIQQHALATSVLFLIPGVPLINAFSDLIDGNIMNGIVRSANGLIISFAIALGLFIAMQLFQI